MSGSYPGKLRVWEAWDLADFSVRMAPDTGRIGMPGDRAAELYARETLRSGAAGGARDEPAEPYTLPWYLHVERQRHERFAKWLPRLLEFGKHAGETLLGLGYGLGTDWVQYARHGASVVVCSPSAEELTLTHRNFELRGLPGKFLHGRPTALPLESASIDVACVNALADELADPAAAADEIQRVLKPGGKVLVLAPAHFDMHYWLRGLAPWQRWLDAPAPGNSGPRFTAKQLRRLFGRFTDHRVHKRHLRRAEVPHVWRWLPLPMLERLLGHFLILKAFKPLSTAVALPAAA